MNKPARAAWDLYREKVIPKNASSIQVQECQRAFYAGLASYLQLTMILGSPEISEDAGVKVLEIFAQEVEEFGREVMAEDARRN